MQEKALPTQLQQYVHLSRYARWLDDENRRETWEETVSRYTNFFAARFPELYPADRINKSIGALRTMPSMRALMTAGPALDKDEMAGYGCSAIAIDHVRAFDEILYILMCGTGVGFSVERQFINNLPTVSEDFHQSDTLITVKDSKIGWASAFRELMSMLYAGQIPKWDVSKVRPAGAKLKTFGGRASGPKPLVDLFNFATAMFKKAAGRKLTSVECHDLVCKVADIVVVGGVRRSALISLSDLSDDRMRVAKSGQWWVDNGQRALANNSAVYTEKPDMETFLEEWMALIQSKSGERGIFNRVAAKKKAAEFGRRNPDFEPLTNPCFRHDTLIHTREGTFPILDLVGKTVEVWDGEQYVEINNFRVTGTNQPVITLTLHDGSQITATPYHRFVLEDGSVRELKDLELGDKLLVSNAPIAERGTDTEGAYIKGFMLGDGTNNGVNPLLWLYGPKDACQERLIASASELPTTQVKATNIVDELSFHAESVYGRRGMRGLTPRREALMPWVTTYKHGLPAEVYAWSTKSKAAFISGLLDSDGTALNNANGFGYQITSVSRQLMLDVQALLKTLNVQSTLRMSEEGGSRDFGERGGMCEVQAVYRLTISQSNSIALCAFIDPVRVQSFAGRTLAYTVKPRFNKIVGIEDAGVEDQVFCCTVPTNHRVALGASIITSQCGEIVLRPSGLCNLTEVVIRAGDTLEDLMDKVEVATIMGTFQSTLSNFRYVRSVWKRNAEEERLLGVSMTGIMDHEVLSKPSDEAAQWLTQLREHAVKVNAEWAAKLGINASVAITTVKPSGTVSQLVDSASGIHPRYSQYYIRTVRADKKDPLAQFMRAEGFPVEDCVMKPDTTDVFAFPVRGPEHAVFRNDMSAIQQLDHYLMFATNWCEHNPSITVYVRDHEWLAVGDWVYRNFDKVGGVSFLPYTDHVYQQAPYTECSEAEYEELAGKMPTVAWSKLQEFEKEDHTEHAQTLACSFGACDLI